MIVGLITKEWMQRELDNIKGPMLVKIKYLDNSNASIEMLEDVDRTVEMKKKKVNKLQESEDFVVLIDDNKRASKIESFEDLLEELEEANVHERI